MPVSESIPSRQEYSSRRFTNHCISYWKKGKMKVYRSKRESVQISVFQIFVCSPTPPIYQLFHTEVDGFFCEKCQFAVFARDNAGKIDSLYCVLWITQKTQYCKTSFSGKQSKEAHWTHIAKSRSMECCRVSIFHNQVLWNLKLHIIGCQLTRCLHTTGSASKPRGVQCLRSYQLDLQLDHVTAVCLLQHELRLILFDTHQKKIAQPI